MGDINKFIEKNKNVYNEFRYFIDKGIEYIVISSELSNFSMGFNEGMDIQIPIIVNPYFPSGRMDLISKDYKMGYYRLKFDVPCVCGLYSDESIKRNSKGILDDIKGYTPNQNISILLDGASEVKLNQNKDNDE